MAYRLAGLCPEGSVVAWDENLGGVTPSLPSSWVRAIGQTISDARSILNGQTIPNMNGDSGGTKRFTRGFPTSGLGTGGADTHTHSSVPCSDNGALNPCDSFSPRYSTSAETSLPPYYEIPWIVAIFRAVIPVGGHAWFNENLTNCPGLPEEFVRGNGQTISDTQSVYNGKVMPDTNGNLSGVNRFHRGSTTSGSTSDVSTNFHKIGAATGCHFTGPMSNIFCPLYLSSVSSHIPAYINAVDIIRIR